MTDSNRPIRLLRLSNSNEIRPFVPAEEQSIGIAAAALRAASGREVEVTVRALWPDPSLGEAVERWVDRFEPDIVSVWASAHPFTYELLMLGLERRIGPLARPLVGIANRAGGQPGVVNNRAWRAARRVVAGSGLATPALEPLATAKALEDALRRIARREDVAIVVRGPQLSALSWDDPASRERGERRRLVVHRHLAEICRQLHIAYIGEEDGRPFRDRAELFLPDGLHATARWHAEMAEGEAPAIVAAWQELHA